MVLGSDPAMRSAFWTTMGLAWLLTKCCKGGRCQLSQSAARVEVHLAIDPVWPDRCEVMLQHQSPPKPRQLPLQLLRSGLRRRIGSAWPSLEDLLKLLLGRGWKLASTTLVQLCKT